VCLATHHTDFGPDEWQLNRIGVTPDVAVVPTPADEAAGRDPQLEAALDILRA
jgi:C-terminal processing protease CtpA/Prc